MFAVLLKTYKDGAFLLSRVGIRVQSLGAEQKMSRHTKKSRIEEQSLRVSDDLSVLLHVSAVGLSRLDIYASLWLFSALQVNTALLYFSILFTGIQPGF